jgi:hypothetical protein
MCELDEMYKLHWDEKILLVPMKDVPAVCRPKYLAAIISCAMKLTNVNPTAENKCAWKKSIQTYILRVNPAVFGNDRVPTSEFFTSLIYLFDDNLTRRMISGLYKLKEREILESMGTSTENDEKLTAFILFATKLIYEALILLKNGDDSFNVYKLLMDMVYDNHSTVTDPEYEKYTTLGDSYTYNTLIDHQYSSECPIKTEDPEFEILKAKFNNLSEEDKLEVLNTIEGKIKR